jgi:PadR family transcriptional regulator, regulatory protein PadR
MAGELPLLKGTVDMLVLKALSWGPLHGFGISQWLDARSEGSLGLDDSSMYQVLHRLEGAGFVDAEWRVTENNRRARFYALTAAGRAHLKAQTATWLRYSDVVTTLMTARTRSAPA